MDSVQKAEEVKSEANQLFKDKHFEAAAAKYAEAIELNPKVAVYWANKAFAETKLEQYGAALNDATQAIELDPKYSKAYYRRGSARIALGKYKEAMSDFKQVVQMDNSREAWEKLKGCQKIIRYMAFQEAIEVTTTVASETIDLDSISVEDDYKGPRLDGEISLDFVTALMEYQKEQKTIHRKYAYSILLQALQLFKSLPTLVDVTVPEGVEITVCGDTHGQYYDLMNIFKINGMPSATNWYLFNGDFVDRGSFSLEVVLLLIAMKLLYPTYFYLSRGNHETISMNKMYGFEGEVNKKLGGKTFDLFTEVFNWLPLCHVLNEKVFVVHGGLFAKDGVKLDDIRKVDRNRQPPEDGAMSDMLWSDPQPFPGRAPSKRGVGVAFGPDVTEAFLSNNNLELVVRSHEVKEEGYLEEANGKLVTVFSAPNYCDQVGNKGAFIRFGPDMKPKYTKFTHVPHPDVKPMAYSSAFGMF